jgi:hypothetical protein
MLKKIIKALLKGKLNSGKHHYSSSDYKKRHYGHNPSKYGHQFYKKKHKSGGFFKSYSSS